MPAVKTQTPERQAPDFKIDGRVSIALDALSEKQKKIDGGLLSDRATLCRRDCEPPQESQSVGDRARIRVERLPWAEYHLQAVGREDRSPRPYG